MSRLRGSHYELGSLSIRTESSGDGIASHTHINSSFSFNCGYLLGNKFCIAKYLYSRIQNITNGSIGTFWLPFRFGWLRHFTQNSTPAKMPLTRGVKVPYEATRKLGY